MIEIDILALMAVAALGSIGVAILWWRTRELERQIDATSRQMELFTEASIAVGRSLNNVLAGTETGFVGAGQVGRLSSSEAAGAAMCSTDSALQESTDHLGRWPVLQLARRKLESGVTLAELEPMLNLSRTECDLLSLLEARTQNGQAPRTAQALGVPMRGGALDTFE